MIQNTTPNPIGSTCVLHVTGAAASFLCPGCSAARFNKREANRYSCVQCGASFMAEPDASATPPASMEAPNA
jgi:predicted RNA-binding Zn-ribbon protein involved in translation (DUF1610 family)